jgi:hypothetical protein
MPDRLILWADEYDAQPLDIRSSKFMVAITLTKYHIW